MRRANGRPTRHCCDARSRPRLLLPTRRCAAATALPFVPTTVRDDRRERGSAVDRVPLRPETGLYSFSPLTQSARIFQFGSSLDANWRPPEWKTLPPASGAGGCCSSRLVAGSPGFTRIDAISKFLRDCSSLQVLAPGDSRSSRNALLLSAWQT